MAGRYHGYLLVCSFTPCSVPPGLKRVSTVRARVSVIDAAHVHPCAGPLLWGELPSARHLVPTFLCRESRGFPIHHPDCLPGSASQ